MRTVAASTSPHEVHHRTGGHGLHRVGDDGLGHLAGLLGNAGVLGLGLVDRVQHLFGSRSGFFGNVVQAAARVGQAVGRQLQLGHHADLGQRVVQQARDAAHLGKHVVGRSGLHGTLGQGLGGVDLHSCVLRMTGGAAQAVAAIFCRILLTLSSSVAFVNGLTM